MKQQTAEQLEQQEKLKKFLLVLPLLILPFLALAFYGLGGGKGQSNSQAVAYKGINTQLPEAQFKKDQPQDKMSLYNQAAQDSVRSKNNAANPLFSLAKPETGSAYGPSADASAEKINQKLAQIGREINKPQPSATTSYSNPAVTQSSTETDKLEKLLKSMNSKNADDPELKQLNSMLDKIAAIQNPGSVQPPTIKPEQSVKPDSAFKAIPAVIEGRQKVAQGGMVRLRLLDTIVLKNITIPKGQLLFGSCNITNQRLLLNIKNIRLGNAIIPVDLSVFSLDGLLGIDAPEAELGEAAGNGIGNGVQGMQFLSMDQSLGVQAAGAGIEAAKGLLNKKVKRIKVKLKDGQRILLRNNQLKNH
ncbi:conjugative transposon TraM protein [Mucilaginibacter gracilis]|uniref:Conjugative transposon TraM protein n=1 Tax=Mucilaginibacter gracilis TaxID=423350 RepID=A0A495J5X9_9SPHI|nr:conjugative transposon protein TraM [Mucilaginibacter gracilis]RKR84277.1 conjugative transposon TraM protein [Mucilaginibacter gracilis]